MGLDITISRRRAITCPHCGEVVTHRDMESVESGGRNWYPFLKSVGYYDPFKTENWYSQDMVLDAKQAGELFLFATDEFISEGWAIKQLVATAEYEGDTVVINADW